MHNLGAGQSLGGGKLQKKISRALQDFHDRPEEHILHVLALRSMSQAVYSAQNIGHFGLGFADYVHFTSPIRRYPDLIIHRQLKACIYKNKGYRLYPEDQLVASGAHLSACEQRSVKAERQLNSIKKEQKKKKFVGHEFEGMISSVTRFGIFVLLRRFDVDGLVRLEDLGDDYFEFDEENLRLVGKHSGAIYSIGSMVNVTVAGVNSDEGQIDFVLAGRFVAPTPKARESGFVKRQKHHKKKAKSSTSGFSLKANRRSLRSTGASKPRGKGKAR